MEIPLYPEFHPITLDDKPAIDSALNKGMNEICEYTFANLFCWRGLYNLSISRYEDLLIAGSFISGEKKLFEPIGGGDKISAVKKLAKEKSLSFIFIRESIIKAFENDPGFEIILDKDNSDYVYNSKDLIELKGKKYDGKRNFIKRFETQNRYSYIKLDEKNARECLAFVERWCKFRDCQADSGLSQEKTALSEMLEKFSYLGLSGGAIEIKGEICALALGEKLNSETFVVHILKAKAGITGLNQTMNREFLAREALNYKYVNMEQDLGIEGLRRSKLSYYPIKMVNKYILKPVF